MNPALTTSDSSFPERLRKSAHGAMLAKRKGDARAALMQLTALLPDDGPARDDLDKLRASVRNEVLAYENTRGEIKRRLMEGADLLSIRRELDKDITHWRAFAEDIAQLHIARDGLDDHENPVLIQKATKVAELLKAGNLQAATEMWRQLGEPDGAADSLTVQVLQRLAAMDRQADAGNWQAADDAARNLQNLLKEEKAEAYQAGLRSHLDRIQKFAHYKKLIAAAGNPPKKKIDRQNLLEQLIMASGEIEHQKARDPLLVPFKEQLDAAAETFGTSEASPHPRSRSLAWAFLFVLFLSAALCAGWYFYQPRSGARLPSDSNGLTPLPFTAEAAGGRASSGDISLEMPNGYHMLFRKVRLPHDGPSYKISDSLSSGGKGLEDSSPVILRAPFTDEDGSYFLVGKCEVSTGQFSQFMPLNGGLEAQTAALPVRYVTAEDARTFCNLYSKWLSRNAVLVPESASGKQGQVRLPLSAEWEFAARGGNPESTAWRENFGAYAKPDQIRRYEWSSESSLGKVRKIGTAEPNLLGLHDMLGNVREIVSGNSTEARDYWMRGGGYKNPESDLTPARKYSMPDLMPAVSSDFRQEDLGFRVVMSTPLD